MSTNDWNENDGTIRYWWGWECLGISMLCVSQSDLFHFAFPHQDLHTTSLQLWSCHPPDWKQPRQCIHVREYYSATRRDRLPTLKRQEDFQSTVQSAKKPDKKSCVSCDPIYMRFWKWHDYRNSRWAFARGWRWEGALDLGLQEVYDILSVWWLLASVHLLIWAVLWQRITSYVIIMVIDIINNLPNNDTLK